MMSSSVTRADVSSWQLQEVTTNPISSSPRRRSTTAKRPDSKGGCCTPHSGTWHSQEGERERGRERGGETKGSSLIVGVTFCVSDKSLSQDDPTWASPSGSRTADEPPRSPADRVSPYFELLLDFDAGDLGGQFNTPFPSSSAS